MVRFADLRQSSGPGSASTPDVILPPAMEFERALAWSRYARDALAADPALRDEIAATLEVPFDWPAARRGLDIVVAAGDGAALAATLRKLRRRVFLHTMARDLTGRAALAEVVATITTLAEVALDAATSLHAAALAATHGAPIGEDTGTRQRLIVIGMGKLGGGELNVSSDVDLVFTYPEEGETNGERALANREFFDRLGRRVIGALADVTADGFVFRVDMRLRPYGDSGPLTVSFAALEHYLITQGRAWERYAWLKARALTGGAHDELARLVTPFVYRKYLDYDAYEELRDVHRQIRAQERRTETVSDIKLGPGGIREVEFVAQALQIVRGGRDPALRVRGTVPALAALTRRRRAARRGGTRAGRGLCVPAQRRAPAAVSGRPADAGIAARRRRARCSRGEHGLRRFCSVHARVGPPTAQRRGAVCAGARRVRDHGRRR